MYHNISIIGGLFSRFNSRIGVIPMEQDVVLDLSLNLSLKLSPVTKESYSILNVTSQLLVRYSS